ncbi:hypothetical protein HYALB_00004905 [Hymenoscyphus albidus]|uniref:Uncharacterized protein n=1 Tax=Hymenoscyphus albidus TaxID=595503 RepID=A0A9N9LG83_9HELO|nr:hypothetical protein HYALB_00004905 [Hymenoscyphus albidus]
MSRAKTEEAEIMEQLQSESQLWSHEGESGKGGQDSDGEDSRATTPDYEHEGKIGWFDLRHPGVSLGGFLLEYTWVRDDAWKLIDAVLWYFFVGFPAAYGVAWLNWEGFRWVGYEKIMRSPSGIVMTRGLFTMFYAPMNGVGLTVIIILVVSWAMQLSAEEKEKRIRKLKEEARLWKKACEILEKEKRELMSKELEGPKAKFYPFAMRASKELSREYEQEPKEPSDYYPTTPKDMIKEVMRRRAGKH